MLRRGNTEHAVEGVDRAAAEAVTDAEFAAMSYGDRTRLKVSQSDVYDALVVRSENSRTRPLDRLVANDKDARNA